MEMERDKLFYKYYRFIVVPLGFLLYLALSYFMNPFGKYWEYLNHSSFMTHVEEAGFGLLTSFFITEVSLACARWLDRWLPWEKQPLVRVLTQTVLLIIGVFMILKAEDLFYSTFFPCEEGVAPVIDKLDEWQFPLVCVIVAFVISAVHTGNYFLKLWKSSMMEAAELQLKAARLNEIAMQAQLQSLKLQLDPHFLFNNFSTLSALIEDEPKLAASFLEKLAKVYRYMITNLNSDVISLSEELKFIEAYRFLIKIRHGENVDIHVKISAANQNREIPPITLQLLIENAIKHNIASPSQPLYILITDEGNELVVRNNIQLIANELPSTKMGLENIKKRYELLFGQSVTVNDKDGQFEVRLPLVDLKSI
ncbi:sensor histidine kinase [Chitinophaga sancti]|uniref:sensor histidine kinase n=1 Tax=Chitinophaga sancti TaxID=1004 RepID=UPI003F79A4FD